MRGVQFSRAINAQKKSEKVCRGGIQFETNGIVKKKILKREGKGPTTGKNNPLERVFLFCVFKKNIKY